MLFISLYRTNRLSVDCLVFRLVFSKLIHGALVLSDSKGTTKRPGSVLHESFRKKLPAINPSEDLPTMGDEGDPIQLE